MRKFLKSVVIFCIPLFGVLIALEVGVHTIPNSYSYKYNFIKSNGNDVRAVAIGHSQFYNDFKPDLFYLPSFNLSNSAQGYCDNYYMLKDLLQYMPNLEMVIMNVGYLNIGREEIFTQRSCYYYEYMNIDYDGQLPLKNRFECLYVRSSLKKLYSYYFNNEDIVQCDSLGWKPRYLKDRESPLGVASTIDIYTLKQKDKLFFAGEKYFLEIIKLLINNNIKLVLVSPPYFWKNYAKLNKKQMTYCKQYVDSICNKYPSIAYVDLECDSDFVDSDFFDESHLSELGCHKFMNKINEALINNIIN